MKKVLTLLLVFTLGLTLASCTNEKDVANVQDAYQKLSVDVKDVMKVTSDLTLPLEGLHESTITWVSNNTEVIANDGKVTRPAVGADDVTVKLTATITIGKETATKEFQFKVLASEPSLAITIAKLESDEVSDGDIVEITGIVVGRIQGKGFHVVDSTGGTYVYLNSNPENVAIGDEVTVLGERSTYFNMHQVKEVQNLTINSSGNAIPAYAAKTIEGLYDEDPVNTTLYNDLVEFDGYVAIMGSKGNAYLVWYDTDLDLHKVEVYYKSGMLAEGATSYDSPEMITLKALEGKLVTAKAVFMDNYKGTFRVSIDTPSTFTEKAITDQEKANLAVAFESDYIQSQGEKLFNNLTLNATSDYVDGAALVWATTDADVIALDGTAGHVIGSEPTADLTVTATVGTATATRTFTIQLVDKTELSGMSVGNALATDDGTLVVVQGVVTAVRENGKAFIQDEDGNGIYIFKGLDVKIGDKVKVKGTLDTFDLYGNLMKQLGEDSVLVEIVSSGNALVFDTTTTAAQITDAINTFHSKLFEMTLVYEKTSYNQYYFTGNGSNSIVMPEEYFPGLTDYIDATTSEIKVQFVVRDINYGDARIVPVAFVDLTNEQRVTIVDNMISVAGDTNVNLDLTNFVSWFDATITWTSTNPAVDATNGAVTQPAVGEGDATGNLVASIVIGTDPAVEKTYAVTVKEFVPAASVADTLALDDETAAFVTGTVKIILSDGTFWIEDTDGTSIYIDDRNATITWDDLTVAVGDKVEVKGLKDTYQITKLEEVSKVTVISSGNDLSTQNTNVTDLAAFRADTPITGFGLTYTFTNVTVAGATSDYIYFYMNGEGTEKIGIYVRESATLPAIAEGDTITLTGIMIGTNKDPYTIEAAIWRFAVTSTDDITVTPPAVN